MSDSKNDLIEVCSSCYRLGCLEGEDRCAYPDSPIALPVWVVEALELKKKEYEEEN